MEKAEAYHFFSEMNKGHESAAVAPADSKLEGWEALVGFWQGTLADELRLIYRVTSKPGQVYLYSLDQLGYMVGASSTFYDSQQGDLAFWFSSIDGVHRAKLDSSGNRIEGVFMQDNSKLPLEMVRFVPTKEHTVPREYEFVLNKIMSGDVEKLVSMEGYWHGYLDDSFDEDEEEPPELVIMEMEKITETLVEPKLFLPDETPLPICLRSVVVEGAAVKIVLDDNHNNAIFKGLLDEEQTHISGTVQYDDVDFTPALTLVKSKNRPYKNQ